MSLRRLVLFVNSVINLTDEQRDDLDALLDGTYEDKQQKKRRDLVVFAGGEIA